MQIKILDIPSSSRFISKAVQYLASDSIPQIHQLVMILANDKFDIEKDVVLGVARGFSCEDIAHPLPASLLTKAKIQ